MEPIDNQKAGAPDVLGDASVRGAQNLQALTLYIDQKTFIVNKSLTDLF